MLQVFFTFSTQISFNNNPRCKMNVLFIGMILLHQIYLNSGQDDADQGVSNVGAALRQYQITPISHKLETKVYGKVFEGGDIVLEVSLSNKSGIIEDCEWTSPEGINFYVEEDTIMDIDGNKQNYYLKYEVNPKKPCFTSLEY